MAAKCIIDSRTCLSHETQPPTNLLGTSSGRSTAMRSRPSTLSAPIIVAPLDSQLLQARRRNSRTVRRGTVSLYTGVIAAHRPGRFFLAAIQKAATPNRHGFATKKGRWEANCMMGSTLSFPTHTREPVPGGVAPPKCIARRSPVGGRDVWYAPLQQRPSTPPPAPAGPQRIGQPRLHAHRSQHATGQVRCKWAIHAWLPRICDGTERMTWMASAGTILSSPQAKANIPRCLVSSCDG
ncbi:hypothetical protein HBI56_168120 [Parastagonospora nodorum]|nr:hypothetical protein HBH56_050620 [Parastagonospora nodorum]KAH3935512.1 hypothetical protein HBH54_036410 [Parastagonospora nodorum]KAH3964184.1 hypothetical protein HBH51_162280 [Parastagonospora nodorum]KAH4053435.1 hypothetical protein HBH49_083630 [Parastagonospora nodorum]KAH4140202.1 hypothetical protein HBH45_086630 [Parastagonospora nodorum]